MSGGSESLLSWLWLALLNFSLLCYEKPSGSQDRLQYWCTSYYNGHMYNKYMWCLRYSSVLCYLYEKMPFPVLHVTYTGHNYTMYLLTQTCEFFDYCSGTLQTTVQIIKSEIIHVFRNVQTLFVRFTVLVSAYMNNWKWSQWRHNISDLHVTVISLLRCNLP